MIHREPPIDFNPQMHVAGCFVEYDGHILLLQRQPQKTHGNKWGLPGGKLDKEEHPTEAILRELKEETGIESARDQLKYIAPFYVRNESFEIVYHMFVLKLNDKPNVVLHEDEHQDFVWATPSDSLLLNYVHDVDGCIREVYGVTLPTISLGIYRHYKGNTYEVLGIGKHTETQEDVVIYKALYGAGVIWVRPYSMFVEEVKSSDYKGPRFVRIEYTEE